MAYSDCKGILDGLRLPRQRLVDAQSRLGRTWSMVLNALDNHVDTAIERLTWVPAHVSAARMRSGPPLTSAGQPLTWLQWRANRLVDAVAKSAASSTRLPASVFKWVKAAEQLHQHQAATLGMVTYAANHHEQPSVDAQGRATVRVLRDSAGQRQRGTRTWRRFLPQQACQVIPPPEPWPASSSSSSIVSAAVQASKPLAPREKRRKLTEEHFQRERVKAATQVATHLAGSTLRPSTGPTASDRLAALRARVQAREVAEKEWELERRRASYLSQ